MTRSQEFIHKFKKKLVSGADFFNPDTSLMPIEKFDSAKCKILVIFPSPHTVKTVSSTAAALNDFIIDHCPETFVDFAYMPEGEDIKLYDNNMMPYAIGNITHLDASHFDMVGFSISVLSEIVTAPVILRSFERCDKPISLWWSDRKDLKIGEQPIIYCGGITAVCGDVMFGSVGDKTAFLDFQYLGSCEKTDILVKRFIEAKETGKVTRNQEDHQTPGYPFEEDPNLVTEVCVNTIQDYIESLFDLTMIFQPQAYEVKYNKYHQIISNKKVNDKARDFVTPYYPHILQEDLGIGRCIINASGDNTGTTQTQIAEGAMLKGTLIRTSKGLLRVEDIAPKYIGDEHIFDGPYVDSTSFEKKAISHAFNHGVKKLKLFTLKSGIQIGLTDEHPVEQWHIGLSDTYFKPAADIKVGDYFIQKKKSLVCGNAQHSLSEAEFLGRMLGDGSYNLYTSKSGDLHHKMYLSCSWDEVEYCEDLLNRANINYTKDETQVRHCRFWILSKDKLGRLLRSDYWGFTEKYGEWDNHVQGKKYIPAPVYQFSESQMKAFLKGFHDADGCTSTSDGLSKVTFDSCHEHIINDIQQFLLFIGIPSKKHYNLKHRCADEELGFYSKLV